MHLLTQVRRYAAAGWRHRWKALGVAWLICLAGWTFIYTIPNQFQSSARLYVDTDAVLSLLLRGIAIDNSPGGQVEVLQRTLLSRPNLEKVVAKTDLDLRIDSPESRERLIQRLATDIRIGLQTRNLFTVEYRDTDPKLARDVVKTVIDQFIESAMGNDRQQMESARQFLAQQIAAYEVKLREAERRRAEFQARYIDLLPSESLGGVSRLEAARQGLRAIRGELTDAQQRRDLLKRQIDAAPATVTEGGGPAGVESRVAGAEQALRELRLRYTDQHPDVVAARSAIAELRAMGGGGAPRSGAAPPRPVTRANPLHEQLSLRMVETDSQLASLERRVRESQAEVDRLEPFARAEPELVAQFKNLDRDYNVMRRNYEELLGRRESLQIAESARTGSDRVKLEVVDPPNLPRVPLPQRRLVLATGVLFAGLGAGAAFAFLLVQLDGGFYTTHDLRRIGLPVLGGLSAPRRAASRRLGSALAFGVGCTLLLLAFGAALAGPTMLVAGSNALLRIFA